MTLKFFTVKEEKYAMHRRQSQKRINDEMFL